MLKQIDKLRLARQQSEGHRADAISEMWTLRPERGPPLPVTGVLTQNSQAAESPVRARVMAVNWLFFKTRTISRR